MGKNRGRSFFILAQDGATSPRGWSKMVFLPLLRKHLTFLQSVFWISFVLSARKFNGRKVVEKIIVAGLFLIFLFQQPTLTLTLISTQITQN
jgi:hypothetical protein